MKLGPVTGWYFHGVSDPSVFRKICEGEDTLRIAPPKSDPGDLGRGVYLTKSKREAGMYGGGSVLRVMVDVDNALHLDFKGAGRASARSWVDSMTSLYGSPVQGRYAQMFAAIDEWERGGGVGPEPPNPRVLWRDRLDAAELWREHLLSQGVGGLSVSGWDFGKTVVLFEPELQVRQIECLIVEE